MGKNAIHCFYHNSPLQYTYELFENNVAYKHVLTMPFRVYFCNIVHYLYIHFICVFIFDPFSFILEIIAVLLRPVYYIFIIFITSVGPDKC